MIFHTGDTFLSNPVVDPEMSVCFEIMIESSLEMVHELIYNAIHSSIFQLGVSCIVYSWKGRNCSKKAGIDFVFYSFYFFFIVD